MTTSNEPEGQTLEAIYGTAEIGDAAVIAATAQAAVTPVRLKPGETYAVRNADGGTETLKVDREATPLRKSAERIVRNATSFLDYVGKHGEDGVTEVYADSENSRIVAVIDAHGETSEGKPGWQEHRATLALVHTPAWKAWTALDGKMVRQAEFANFVELNASDVRRPDAATFVEIASKLHGATRVEWKSGERLGDGEIQLSYVETAAANAVGKNGRIDIPEEFVLKLRPYLNGPLYEVVARFRYRFEQGGAVLGFALVQPDRVLEAAFNDIVETIRFGQDAETIGTDGEKEGAFPGVSGGIPVLYGKP